MHRMVHVGMQPKHSKGATGLTGENREKASERADREAEAILPCRRKRLGHFPILIKLTYDFEFMVVDWVMGSITEILWFIEFSRFTLWF